MHRIFSRASQLVGTKSSWNLPSNNARHFFTSQLKPKPAGKDLAGEDLAGI
ncbi:hypothetical protein [Persicirhabdus sediminis]|uniref:Uncharacterized protein n=1 Tax=Persicirhabdus sediminis TaxID=454144 RepID=A0A8J7ME10_9BACT|nr:hypothetical protein [Persicirhabdus sediminis]MBK1790798.1 hypothetical protein [Persicirhabdus sediminis]